MSKVVFDISISLDGFITGPEQATEGPLGRTRAHPRPARLAPSP
jgi:hypothetical protein